MTPERRPLPAAAPSWHACPVPEALARLESDAVAGLPQPEVARRLQRYGPNALAETGRAHWATVLLRQFSDALIGILAIAAVVALAMGEIVDAVAIAAILLANGALGFVQEWRAERVLEALRSMLAPRAIVRRDGADRQIDATGLVPGDVVVLPTGGQVPADLRLLEACDLCVDEAVLTGESAAVPKAVVPLPAETALAERASMAWAGTAVTSGRGLGVVVATGMTTEFGRIARLAEEVEAEATPLERTMRVLGRQLGAAALVVATVVAVAGVVAGEDLLTMFMTGISLAVAVVPEGLPAVVTISLALGVRAMARRHALVRRLQAAETLGAATVIATDKTGTLTENRMTVQRIELASGGVDVTGDVHAPVGAFEVDGRRIDPAASPDLRDLLASGLACNHARLDHDGVDWRPLGEPTEVALVVAARKAGLTGAGVACVAEAPFTSARKRMTVVEAAEGGRIAHVKGAPEAILPRCEAVQESGAARPFAAGERARFAETYQRLARRGLRTLAIARRVLAPEAALDPEALERDLVLLGIVGIIDPPRAEVRDAVAVARAAGIRIVMVTGDAPETADAIGRQIGLPPCRAVTGGEIDAMDDASLARLLADEVLFARTTPEHKLRLVTLLQGMGHVVAMTGDGVNDAPALKRADVGVAMGIRGTDVARGAADMVLTDDNFASIVAAIEEGRRQYDNIRKFTRYLLSSNTGEVLAILVNILLGATLILTPVQILWMNLVTDGVTAVTLSLEPTETGAMRRPPRARDEPILGGVGLLVVLALGAYMGLATVALFHWYLAGGPAAAAAQTVAFTGLVLMEKANVLNFRALSVPIAAIGAWSNPWLLVALAAMLGLQAAAVYVPLLQGPLDTVPLAAWDWVVMLAVAAPIVLVPEVVKWRRARAR